MNWQKTLSRILRGHADATIRFDDLCQVLTWVGFDERVRGSHHIFTCDDVEEILNLRPHDSLAKSYQVKQVREVLIRYQLAGGHDDE